MLLEERDYFTDRVVLKDPYDYFADLFSKDPIYQPRLRDVMFVTGFEEANAILRNSGRISRRSSQSPALPCLCRSNR